MSSYESDAIANRIYRRCVRLICSRTHFEAGRRALGHVPIQFHSMGSSERSFGIENSANRHTVSLPRSSKQDESKNRH